MQVLIDGPVKLVDLSAVKHILQVSDQMLTVFCAPCWYLLAHHRLLILYNWIGHIKIWWFLKVYFILREGSLLFWGRAIFAAQDKDLLNLLRILILKKSFTMIEMCLWCLDLMMLDFLKMMLVRGERHFILCIISRLYFFLNWHLLIKSFLNLIRNIFFLINDFLLRVFVSEDLFFRVTAWGKKVLEKLAHLLRFKSDLIIATLLGASHFENIILYRRRKWCWSRDLSLFLFLLKE